MQFRSIRLSLLLFAAVCLLAARPAAAQLDARYLCVDGVDDYASVSDNSTLDVGTGANDDFTLETFFYVPDTSNTTTDTLIWKQGSYGVYIVYNFSLAGGADRIIFRIWTGVGASDYVFLYGDTNLSAGWHHVAAIWDNENTATWDYMGLYVDGTLIASGSNIEMTPGLLNTSSPLQIGAFAGTNPAVGGFEETRISDVVRYTGASFTVPSSPFTSDANTRALWHFDALPGATSFTDSSGNGNTLTGINGAQTCGVGCGTITLTPATLPDGQHGTFYSEALGASGGTAPYTFAVTSGTLPPGLTLSSAGVLSGTPSAAGTYGFTVTATDDSTCTGSQSYSVNIACPTVTVTPATLSGGTTGSAYNATIGATGGTPSYTFAVTTGTLPPGLTLASNGALSGTPSTTGSYDFTVTATDAQSCTGTRSYTVEITCPTITVTPATLSGGTTGASYNATIGATGGTPSYSFAVTTGTLPPGLTLASNGSLSGTPSTVGDYNFTVTATDSLSCTGSRGYSVSITCPTITVTPATLPGGINGAAYSTSLGASGGTAAYTFAVTTGTLPPGLSLASNGLLSGTPSTNGSYDFTITATDALGCTGSRAYSMQIAARTVNVSPTTLTVSETGTSLPFSIVLGSAPSGNVVIDVASNDTTEATASPAQLTFTTGNWSVAQNVTVTGVNDALVDGDQTATIVVSMNAGTADSSYLPIDPADVVVTVLDDENLHVVSTNPVANAVAASRATNIAATANDTILPATVTQAAFRVHASQTGRRSGAYSASGATFQLDPTATLKPGETVQVTATSAITNTLGVPLRPRVWQFTAATAASPGAMRPHPTTPTLGTGHSFGIALGDIDGDNDVDALVANYSSATDVWVNNGTGAFSAHPTAPSFGSTESERVVLGDLDNDGDLDAIVCKRYGPLYVWLNDGTGVFTPHPTSPTFGNDNPIDVVLGDLDADGDLDALLVNATTYAGSTWLNGGTGNFTAHPTVPTFGTFASGEGIAVGDIDGDGDLDAIIANTNGEAETVWVNGGSGNFSAHPTTPQFGADNSLSVALGDLDGDGDLDAIVGNVAAFETVWRNDGSGNFSPHPTTPSFDAGYETRAIALGDIDGDGDLDAAFADWTGGSNPARIYRNDGAASFSPFGNYQSGYTADLGLADLDGDGDLDMMTAHSFDVPEKVWINGAPGIVITPTSPLETTEAGGTATFTVVLTSYPMSLVTVPIQTSNLNEGKLTYEIGPTQTIDVQFGTNDWNIPKTVTITGIDDAIDDGDVTYTIATLPATSSDPLYNGLDAADLSVINRDDDGPPAFLTAAATSATQVTLNWGAVTGAGSYEVHRATAKSGPFTIVGTPAGTNFVDSVAANTTYIYKVRRSGGSAADFSAIDIATTVIFTDPVLNGLLVRGVHIEQLRTAVNAVRVAAELPAASFTDAAPLAGKPVQRVHLIELRTALDQARASIGLPAMAYGEGITALVTTVKRTHVEEIRAGTQ